MMFDDEPTGGDDMGEEKPMDETPKEEGGEVA